MTRLALLVLLAPLGVVIVQVEAPQQRITQRILFVVDASGSMDGPEFGRAVSAVQKIAGQPIDQLEIAVVAFNDEVYRWDGVKGDKIPAGWAAMPSQEAVDKASRWLGGLGAQGDTLVIPAIKKGLAEKRTKLSVVLVTDGQFHSETAEQILKAIEEGQRLRSKQDLGKAVVAVYGVGAKSKVLARIGKAGKGGYFQETQVLPPTPPLIQGFKRR